MATLHSDSAFSFPRGQWAIGDLVAIICEGTYFKVLTTVLRPIFSSGLLPKSFVQQDEALQEPRCWKNDLLSCSPAVPWAKMESYGSWVRPSSHTVSPSGHLAFKNIAYTDTTQRSGWQTIFSVHKLAEQQDADAVPNIPAVHQQFPSRILVTVSNVAIEYLLRNMLRLRLLDQGIIVFSKGLIWGTWQERLCQPWSLWQLLQTWQRKWWFWCHDKCQSTLGHVPRSGHPEELQMVWHPWGHGSSTSQRATCDVTGTSQPRPNDTPFKNLLKVLWDEYMAYEGELFASNCPRLLMGGTWGHSENKLAQSLLTKSKSQLRY